MTFWVFRDVPPVRQWSALSLSRDCVARQLWELSDRVQMAVCTERTPSVIAHSMDPCLGEGLLSLVSYQSCHPVIPDCKLFGNDNLKLSERAELVMKHQIF